MTAMTNKWYQPRDARIQAVLFEATTFRAADGPAWLRDAGAEGVVRMTVDEATGFETGTLTISNPFLGDHICEDGWYICRAHDGTICACAPEGFALGYEELPEAAVAEPTL